MTEADRTVYAQELLSWSHLLDTVVVSFEDYMVDREEEDAPHSDCSVVASGAERSTVNGPARS